MSLQIALQQIQMPSFWHEPTTSQGKERIRDRTSDNNARRNDIMRILRSHGKPMDYATLSAKTGMTWFSLRNLINTLVKEGQVMRSKAGGRDGKSLVEAI